jgi:uncharacterized membrane protein YphA (DoxX/SURF4 family)
MRSQTRIEAGRSERVKGGALLWTLQALLAALFLFAGTMKLILPIHVLTAQTTLSGSFLRFIGLCETLGALGLILPGLLRLRTGLTPLAALGLVIIMVGATVVTAQTQGIGPALFPLVVGLLVASVGYGRWRRVPLRRAERGEVLEGAA